MKIAVVYQSKSGNVRALAEEIYDEIDINDKELVDIDEVIDIPEADFYFIGFGIHNNNCGIDVTQLFDDLVGIKYALFMSCGFYPTDKYKNRLLNNLRVWLPEHSVLVDTFLCQGRVEKHEKDIMLSKLPQTERQLKEMFLEGDSHPNETDLMEVRQFTRDILNAII